MLAAVHAYHACLLSFVMCDEVVGVVVVVVSSGGGEVVSGGDVVIMG